MLIEIATLPLHLQEQILSVQQGNTVQFAHHGKIIAKVTNEQQKPDNKLIGGNETFGLWRERQIDGVAYQDQIRSEWDREWD